MAEPISGPKEAVASGPQIFHHFPFLPSGVRSKIWTLALFSPSYWKTSQSLLGTPFLHKPSLITFHRSRSAEASLAHPDVYLAPYYGDDWQDGPLAEYFRREAADHCDCLVVRYRASRTRVFKPPRKWSRMGGEGGVGAGRGKLRGGDADLAKATDRRAWGAGKDSGSKLGCEGAGHGQPVPTLRREDAFKAEELDERKRRLAGDMEMVKG
ncbi:hypothetical protein MMYC01_201920 [Madurella mycetomatis]|uniref:Uncharacterized protein n=1 Tax=Madurella mycetomatis TaxID=100816 RepID=A0A175WC56_9PEZI|nr:hypothetical protein MMYC01_201920 [Madurella mycetomatis]